MAKPLLIAIGVHNANGLDKIDAALLGVSEISAWARARDYDVFAFTDDPALPEPARAVTADKIKAALTADVLLGRPRIVVYFCGHGLHAAQDQHWVLSAGPGQKRISAMGFRDALETYGPEQVAIIADACRTAWVSGASIDNVVDNYEGEVDGCEKDTFFSTRDGAASYAVPAKDGAPPYCVFTRTLMQALAALEADPSYLDEQYLAAAQPRHVITSQSLADYLEDRVPVEANAVNKTQKPKCNPGFRYPDDIYVEFGRAKTLDANPGGPAPILPHGGIDPPSDNDPLFESLTRTATRSERRQARRDQSRSEWRGPLVNSAFDFLRTTGVGRCALFIDTGPTLRNFDIQYLTKAPITPALARGPHERIYAVPMNGGSDAGLVIAGPYATPVVTFNDLYAAIVFRTRADSATPDADTPDGVDLLSYASRYDSIPEAVTASVEALKGLSAGFLRTEDVPYLAAEMRWYKHQNPLLGMIAAYLYNNIGDIDGIRRMAYFYRANDQDLPFDIALLTRAPLELKDGQFWVRVPAVDATPPNRRAANAPDFTWRATPASDQPVAGLTPLLRAGWQRLDTSVHRIHRECAALLPALTNSTISTFAGDSAVKKLRHAFEDFWSGKF